MRDRLEWQIEKCFNLETELEKEKQGREEAENNLSNLVNHFRRYSMEQESFVLLMEVEKADKHFKKYGEQDDR